MVYETCLSEMCERAIPEATGVLIGQVRCLRRAFIYLEDLQNSVHAVPGLSLSPLETTELGLFYVPFPQNLLPVEGLEI